MPKSQLINDLHSVPEIIAALGLAIADAQKRLNLDYLQALERVLVMALAMTGNQKGVSESNAIVAKDLTEDEKKQREKFSAELLMLVQALVPPRYQFTETTLTVRLDLAQSLQVGGSVGVAAGVGAVAVNASMSVGFGYDYRAAAECKTVLHAVPPGADIFQALLARASELNNKELKLPEDAQLDKDIRDQSERLFQRMTGFLPAPVTPEE